MRRLRIGVIGAGHLGRIHARILSNLDGVRMMGVADPAESAREAVAESLRTAVFADFRELLQSIDAAIIAAPTFLHRELGLEVIAAGKHVMIEKPLATSAAAARELTMAAEAAGVILQVGHIERFNPAVTAAAPVTRNPKYIDATRCGGFTGRSLDVGVVLDLMIHDLDLILSMNPGSAVDRVEALGMAVLGTHEDLANARIMFANGCVANISASRISPKPERRMQVFSEAGFARLDFASRSATVVSPATDLLTRQFDIAGIAPSSRAEQVSQALAVEEITPEPLDQLTAELLDFVLCIKEGHTPRCTGHAGTQAIELAEQILAGIAQHSWNGRDTSLVGPQATPAPTILRGPHWNRVEAPTETPVEHREAS